MSTDAKPWLLKPAEVAAELNESLSSTYRRLVRGELLAIRLSGNRGPLRVPRSELEAFLARSIERGSSHD